MIYCTGDCHGRFDKLFRFCNQHYTSHKDVMVILGDAGINYWGDMRDDILKKQLSELPILLLCVHGNHERRPQTIPSYETEVFRGGIVYIEPDYPSIMFAQDGQIFKLGGQKCMVAGGAYSVDKFYRLERGFQWFEDEQPDNKTKSRVERKLFKYPVDIMLTHTCPEKYIPTEMFLPQIDQSTVDNSTEEWLDMLEDSVDYKKWYCGHYHTDKTVDNIRFLYNDIVELK